MRHQSPEGLCHSHNNCHSHNSAGECARDDPPTDAARTGAIKDARDNPQIFTILPR
ncbi:hypothetical protein Acsp05_16900 [Actinokineospora sp. NBRC 105648]|nr:hypothetical protein Acsp05_16900 [Actinokineospora sp. NBRC 105648]